MMETKYKVLLVTLQGANIGNRLQNYALQEVLNSEGCEVYTPYYDTLEYDTKTKKIKEYVKILLGNVGIPKYKVQSRRYQRENRYKKFDGKYISKRFKTSFENVFQMNWSSYDFAITGSDQVWHRWSDNQNELRYFYLQFMPKNKRIAYAPSFGFDEFSEKDKEIHLAGIQKMECLSAREESGKALMKQVTERHVELVLDPTLLLTRDKWELIEKKPKYGLPEKYILVYFLGDKTEEYKKAISWKAKKHSAEIIDILDEHYVKYYFTTPDEFVWLVDHAEFIMTDSFHACVFSIIYHKRFSVFQRVQEGFRNMFGRIETLLNTCGLSYCIYSTTEKEKEVDWEKVDLLLEDKRRNSIDYIENSVSAVTRTAVTNRGDSK